MTTTAQQFATAFIDELKNNGYNLVELNGEHLLANFKNKIEKLNQKRLPNQKLTATQFERVCNQVLKGSFLASAERLKNNEDG